jgi:hypothetical protein
LVGKVKACRGKMGGLLIELGWNEKEKKVKKYFPVLTVLKRGLKHFGCPWRLGFQNL